MVKVQVIPANVTGWIPVKVQYGPKIVALPALYSIRIVEKYYMNDPGQSAKNVACLAYIFSQYAIEEMNNDPDNWMTDPGIEEGTNWLLVEQDKSNMGLIDIGTRGKISYLTSIDFFKFTPILTSCNF